MDKPTLKRLGKFIAGVVILLYAVVCMVAYSNQRDMMYHPEHTGKTPEELELPLASLTITSADGTELEAWYRLPNPDQPVIVFLHGNSGDLSTRAQKYRAFLDRKYGVFAVAYRGFGKSKGSPDEEGIYADARAGIEWLKERGIPTKDMILYGESLGTAVAVQMATEYPDLQAMVLESPFTSMAAAGKNRYWYLPVSLLLKDRYDSLSKIKDVKIPVAIGHGKEDTVVPVEEGEELFEAANEPKKMVAYPGINHSTIDTEANLIILGGLLGAVDARKFNIQGVRFTPKAPEKAIDYNEVIRNKSLGLP